MNKQKLILLLLLVLVLLAYISFKFFLKDAVNKLEPITQKKQEMGLTTTQSSPKINNTVDNKKTPEKPILNPHNNTIELSPENPIPNLSVQVQGVFLGKKKESGYTLIVYNGALPQVYMVGAKLAEGVVLKSLAKGEIVIDNHGNMEKYFVKKEKKRNTKLVDKAEEPKPNLPNTPPMDSDPPPLVDFTPPPLPDPALSREGLTPAQSKEFVPPPPDGGMGPFGY
jgi:type II secretory pathway component PulC